MTKARNSGAISQETCCMTSTVIPAAAVPIKITIARGRAGRKGRGGTGRESS